MKNSISKHKAFVKEKFDRLVARYDLVNSLLSFYQDSLWRKRVVYHLKSVKGPILDLCCGPYTLSLKLLKSQKSPLFALDLSFEMLHYGKIKISNYYHRIYPLRGDGEKLPFKEESMEAITIAFGFRNLPNRREALEEFYRVLKKGGRLLILEFSMPKNFLFKTVYLFYLRYYVPFLGGILTGDKEAYDYLAKSIQEFPPQEEVDKLLCQVGFQKIKIENLTFGVVSLYHYIKP